MSWYCRFQYNIKYLYFTLWPIINLLKAHLDLRQLHYKITYSSFTLNFQLYNKTTSLFRPLSFRLKGSLTFENILYFSVAKVLYITYYAAQSVTYNISHRNYQLSFTYYIKMYHIFVPNEPKEFFKWVVEVSVVCELFTSLVKTTE